MATVLRIRLADLLPVLAPGLSQKAQGLAQNGITQLKLTSFKTRVLPKGPEVRPLKTTKPNMGSQIDEQEAIQRYLRSGPATHEDLLSAATLRRLNLLRQRGDIVLLADDSYMLQEAL